MARIEELQPGIVVKGILPDQHVTIVTVDRQGGDAIELVYKDSHGTLGVELLFRDKVDSLEIVTEGLPWSFDGTEQSFDLYLRHIEFNWHTYLTRYWQFIPQK